MLKVALRDWLRMLRTLGIGRLGVCLGLSCVLAVVLPGSVPVPLREASANPWSVVWAIPAVAMPIAVDSRFDFMARTLPFRLELQRLFAVGTFLLIAATAVVLTGLATTQPVEVGLRNLLGCFAVSLLVATLLVGDIASLLLFVGVLVVWVFGREPITSQPYGWAVLLHPATWTQVVGAGVLCCLAGGCWARIGPRGARP